MNLAISREGVGESGWVIQCQLRIYLWLGMIKDFRTYKSGLPEGFDVDCFKKNRPPDELLYRGERGPISLVKSAGTEFNFSLYLVLFFVSP
ncbi:unnamed protein product [Protopolystoma xenopodis]|uniref:Uncharacterized protein n=1 Tax=Protopolystoma xenopodis TaxID=117903 RepID=A0A448X8S7_9PLAT|nr:unnamed protein product [Protopolystoma xenopodis]